MKSFQKIFIFLLFLFLIIVIPKCSDISNPGSNLVNKFEPPINSQLKLEPNRAMCAKYNETNKLLVFIYVLVSVDYLKRRQAIRNTWANLTDNSFASDFRVIFLVGLSKREDLNEKLIEENRIYNDILQGKFFDSYQFLTDKNTMVFKWISTYCSHTHFVLKIIDDVVVNINGLFEFLNGYFKKNLTIHNVLMGNFLVNSRFEIAYRNPNTKWDIPLESYNKPYYDPFPSSPAFLLSFDLSRAMYDKSLTFKSPVWMDDVYMGLLARQLNTYLYDIAFAYVPKWQYDGLTFQQKCNEIIENKINKTLFVYAREDDYYQLWSFIKKK
jgi:beta-1,3-galactosyltransferase 1